MISKEDAKNIFDEFWCSSWCASNERDQARFRTLNSLHFIDFLDSITEESEAVKEARETREQQEERYKQEQKEKYEYFMVRLPKGSTLKPIVDNCCKDNYTILVSPKDFDQTEVIIGFKESQNE